MKQPNILFIMTDEQKWNTFGYNNKLLHTPNLDALIKDSIFFNKAYCSNPSCIPSRAGIVTGKFPTVCKTPTFLSKLPKEEKTFMSSLQEAGYHTAVVGKQHFAHSEIAHGYDYENIVDGHSPKGNPEEIPTYISFLREHGVDLTKCTNSNLIIGREWIEKEEYHIDNYVGNFGKAWLEGHLEEKNDKPWFFTLSYPGPHQPYDVLGTSYDQYYDLKDMTLEETSIKDIENKPPHFREMTRNALIDGYDEVIFQKTKKSYYANMSLIDEQVGSVISLLKENGEYDNTMIIFSTDHGDFMGDFGFVAKAQYLTEGLMHIPLFVKPPIADFKGYEVDDYVTNIDIASTCLHVAERTDLITKDMENHPYSAYWTEENVEPREYIYMEAQDLKCVIEDGIKVVYYVNRDYGEVYDLKIDSIEKYNLWDDEVYREVKEKAFRRIINQMFKMAPNSDEEWNVKAPSI